MADTVGCDSMEIFATPGWRIPPRTYSRQYETPNHEYNVPQQGTQDWHNPLNENFEAFEVDIELRDGEANLGDYTIGRTY